MTGKNIIQSEISGHIANLFQTHFGREPTTIYVAVESPFITIHFRGFLAANEKNLINQNEKKRVLATRDMIIRNLEPEITRNIEAIAGHQVMEFYTDWDFENETGLMIGIIDADLDEQHLKWPNTVEEGALREYIKKASAKSQITPDHTDFYWLNDCMVLVRRSGILLEIEKEFIKNGFIDELKVSKRQLERRAFEEAQPEKVWMDNIEETYLYWNFDKDLGYTVFRLESQNY